MHKKNQDKLITNEHLLYNKNLFISSHVEKLATEIPSESSLFILANEII